MGPAQGVEGRVEWLVCVCLLTCPAQQMAPSRRLVSVGPTWATAIVTAVSSSDSSSEQPTVAIANAIATDDSTAVAVSKASNNSTVNATAIATGEKLPGLHALH